MRASPADDIVLMKQQISVETFGWIDVHYLFQWDTYACMCSSVQSISNMYLYNISVHPYRHDTNIKDGLGIVERVEREYNSEFSEPGKLSVRKPPRTRPWLFRYTRFNKDIHNLKLTVQTSLDLVSRKTW